MTAFQQGKKNQPLGQQLERGRRQKTKKEEKFKRRLGKKTQAEENGISNRPIYPIFIPPLTHNENCCEASRKPCKFALRWYVAAMLKPDANGIVRVRRRGGRVAAKLHDKQSERDGRELRIDKVGVRGLRFPIQVRDKPSAGQNTGA